MPKEKPQLLKVQKADKNRLSTDFLIGGGQMGELIRSFNWSKTAVGAVDQWPQSLRTAVNMVFNSAFPMFIWWGKKELTFFYNDSYSVILGKKHPKALGKSGASVWSEIWEDVGPWVKRVFTTGKPVFLKDLPLTMNRHGYEEQTYFTFSYSPIHDETGTIGGIYCACVETTDEVMGRRKLEESEERFRALVSATSDVVYRMSPDWSEMRQLEGRNFLASTGKPDRKWLKKYIHPKDQRRVVERIEEAIRTKSVFQLEHQVMQADGSLGWTFSRAIPIFNKNGDIIEWFGAASDITERKLSEEALRRASKQKDEFIGIASHELKTPVTSIKAYTQLLNLRFRKAEDMRSSELVGKMDGQLNKLSTLINDLLDVTKIESGKLQFHERYFDMNELIGEIVEEIQRTAHKHTIRMKVGRTKSFYGDRDRIGQVLTNFITNAIKYSPRADTIIVKSKSNNHSIIVSVQDFGIGIPENKEEKVFERFYRVEGDKQETFAGMGIGLYVSMEIINRHNGNVWVKSEEGKGSTFYFSLPLSRQKVKQLSNISMKNSVKHG